MSDATQNPRHQLGRDVPPRLMVTVDIVPFSFADEALSLLLIQRRHPPHAGKWALPGGFVDIAEGLGEAAARELQEETALIAADWEQFQTYGDPDRDPRGRVITVAYLALISRDLMSQAQAGDDARDATWFGVGALPQLAFDHQRIIDDALTHLRAHLATTARVLLLLPSEFTLRDAQRLYEVIGQETLDKRNFRRQILGKGVLQECGRLRYGDHRPAQLYQLHPKAIE